MKTSFRSLAYGSALALLVISAAGILRSPTAAASPSAPTQQASSRPAVRANVLAISPDGQFLATAHRENQVELWDCQTGKLIRYLPGSISPPSALVFSADGRYLAGASYTEVCVWDLKDMRLVKTLPRTASFPCIAFSPDGKLLAYGANDAEGKGAMYVFDLAADRLTHTLKALRTPTAVAFSPDRKSLAVGTRQGLYMGWVALYDLATGTSKNLDIQYRYADQLMFSADGKLLVAGYPNFKAMRLPLEGRSARARYEELWPKERVTVLAFAPGAGKVVVCIGTETRVMDLASMKTLKVLPQMCQRASFSADAKVLAVIGPDGTVEFIQV